MSLGIPVRVVDGKEMKRNMPFTEIEPPNRCETSRINLVIPSSLSRQLQETSRQLEVTQVDLARHLLKFGLAALLVSLKPGGGVFITEPGGELEKVALQYML